MEVPLEKVTADALKLATGRRELTCVLFPGIVRDHERAIECLGGIREVSTVYSEPTKKRLGLTFSPENPFGKKTFGDRVETSALLLRVRVRRRRGCSPRPLSAVIVGEVNSIYKFESMLDFALLPAPLLNAPDAARCVLEQLVPAGCDQLEWLYEPAPCFIVPTHFTRTDKPRDYRYTDNKCPLARRELISADHDHHYRMRANRLSHVIRVQFSLAETLPVVPSVAATRALQTRLVSAPALATEVDLVQKMFAERPVWSKNALRYFSKISSTNLKYILPTVGIYFSGGPWRQLWVRFGYDPRVIRSSLIYQTLDFRMRHFNGASSQAVPRLSQHVHKKLARPSERRNPFAEQPEPADVPESAVVFRAGLAPNQRQIFYQFCDLKVPEVEETLARLVAGDGAGEGAAAACHARRGWMPAGLHDRVRATLLAYARRVSTREPASEEAAAKAEAAEWSGDEEGARGGGGDAPNSDGG